jgi:hypothetical protein
MEMSPNFTKHGDISGASPYRHLQVFPRGYDDLVGGFKHEFYFPSYMG